MTLRSLDPNRPWTDYTITSQQSGKTYRVSLRGFEPGQSYCSCPDFRTNHLGTCKHVLHAQAKIKKRFPQEDTRQALSATRTSPCDSTMASNSDCVSTCRIDWMKKRARSLARFVIGRSMMWTRCCKCMRALERAGHSVHVYPDAEEFVEQRLLQRRLAQAAGEIRRDPTRPSTAEGTAATPSCCLTSWTASPLQSGPVAPFWPTTWDWARPFKASASPNCSLN